MNFNKKPIDKISEDRLDWLLSNQSLLNNIPKDVDNKIINYYRNKKYNLELKKSSFFTNSLKFLAVAASFIIICVIFYFFYIINNKNHLYSKIIQTKGNIIINNKQYVESSNKIYILKGKTLTTGKKSKIHFIIGNNSIIKLNELSKIKILQSKKKKNEEFTKIYLLKGSINFSVKLSTTNSKFEVIVNSALFSVKGTKFDIELKNNNDVYLNVTEGVVEISNYIKINSDLNIIKNKNKEIYNDLIKIKNIRSLIKKGESIVLKNNLIKEYNTEQNKLIEEIILNIKNKNQLNKNDRRIIDDKINNLIEKSNDILVHLNKNKILLEEKDKNKKDIIIKKIPLKLNIKLTESDTTITSDNRNIYVSSGKDKTVYCIDPLKEILKWKVNNKRIKNITSPAFPYKDKIILCTPDNIIIINMDGKIIKIIDIPMGPSYWASPKNINDSLYIPTFDTLYKFKNNDLSLNEILKSNGQMYINSDLENIYYTVLNEKKIKIYNIKKNKIIWESQKFKDRAFIPPIKQKDNIYVGDISGYIYKYSINKNSVQTIINEAGIMSDMIHIEGYLYFIANNGFLYRINTSIFKEIEKIEQIEVNPDLNKFLTKNLIIKGNLIYYCSDTGKIFTYDIINKKGIYINIPDNINNLPLIGKPIVIDNKFYFIDVESNIYKLIR